MWPESPLGAPKATHLEHQLVEIEQFLAILRFAQRTRLIELEIDIQMGVQDGNFVFTSYQQCCLIRST